MWNRFGGKEGKMWHVGWKVFEFVLPYFEGEMWIELPFHVVFN